MSNLFSTQKYKGTLRYDFSSLALVQAWWISFSSLKNVNVRNLPMILGFVGDHNNVW